MNLTRYHRRDLIEKYRDEGWDPYTVSVAVNLDKLPAQVTLTERAREKNKLYSILYGG